VTTQPSFTGYPGTVWSTCYQSLTWLNGLLASGATAAAAVANPAFVVFETLRNGSTSIEAWQNGAALSIEAENMAYVEALPITLDPTTTVYFTSRIAAISLAASGIAALPPVANPFAAVASLQNGQPAIAYPGYLEWCQAFDSETAPTALATQTLPVVAQSAATAWLTVTNAVGVAQGMAPTSAYDTAARQYRCSQVIANLLAQIPSVTFPVGASQQTWNGVAALPTILLDGSSLSTSPAQLQAQQAMVIRYILDQTAGAIAQFLFSLRTSIANAPITAILSNNDTLIDLAARETGNFENWTEIAAINGLTPPYPGPTNPAVAQSGRQLYMPGSNVTLSAAGNPPLYPNDVLGTDYYFGPINGVQPSWNGDIPLITGLLNFAAALGRRIQTPIGALAYHQEYGSRIPGEVGAIQSIDEASRLAAFGKAALAADKRTGRILSAIATVTPPFEASFAGVVNPIGPGTNPVQFSTTITTPGAPA
jgi:hypothetical protein